MIAVGLVSGLSLTIVQVLRDQDRQISRSQLDSDMAATNAQIMTYLSSPNHCNANFYGKPLTGTPAAVYRCNSTVCHGSNEVIAYPKITTGVSSTDAYWAVSTTKISSKLRISSLSYSVATVTGTALAALTYNVVYQMRLDALGGASSVMRTSRVKKYTIPVIVNGATSTIVGCPITWNSTTVY